MSVFLFVCVGGWGSRGGFERKKGEKLKICTSGCILRSAVKIQSFWLNASWLNSLLLNMGLIKQNSRLLELGVKCIIVS